MTYKTPTITTGTNGTGSTASLSITRPTALRVGDLMVLCVATEAGAIAAPTGFVPVVSELVQAGIRVRVWYKFAEHNEPATYTVTLATADDSIYNLFLVRGVSPFDVINVTDQAQGNAGLPIAEPGVTTTVDNCLAIGLLACDGSPRVIVQPTGWTLIDSEDGPAGSLSWGLASKAIATAGASGGANWTATDSTATDYVAITFAITPGVMSRGDGIIYAPQMLLAKTLADCTEFRNLVGASTHAEAFARIWHESLPNPADATRDVHSKDELIAYRPFAMIYVMDSDGETFARQSMTPGAWSDAGTLRIMIEINTPDELKESPALLDQLMKQLLSRIVRRPSDETSGSFYGLADLSHRTNETDGYSYLAADHITFRGYYRASYEDIPAQGDHMFAWLEVRYGQGGG